MRRLAGSPRMRRAAAPRGRVWAHARRRSPRGSHHIRYVSRRADAAAHHRRVAHRDPRGAPVLPRGRRSRWCSAPTRPCRAPARGRPQLRRGDDELLARLGARPRDPVRMAGCGDPRRDHAEAQRVRRTGAIVAAMTTSIPEAPDPDATGTIATAGCATATSSSTRSTASARRDDGEAICSYLVDDRRGARRGPLQPVYRHQRQRAARRAGRRRRCPAIAAWGRCASATTPTGRCSTTSTAPRSWRRRTRSSTSGCSRTRRRALSSVSSRSGGARSRCTTSPTRAVGAARQPRVHTFSSVMCWAACDRLARIAARLAWPIARRTGAARPSASAAFIESSAGAERGRPSSRAVGGGELDASLLLLAELGFLRADDPRFARRSPRSSARSRGDFVFRYVERRTTSARPENAFIVCTFWCVDALARLGRRDEARALFERLLALPQPARPAGGAPRRRHRRAVGQLPADLQDGRHHQRRGAALEAMGHHGVSAAATEAPYPRLLGDIGGTGARFGWVAAPGEPIVALPPAPGLPASGLEAAIRAELEASGLGMRRPAHWVLPGPSPATVWR